MAKQKSIPAPIIGEMNGDTLQAVQAAVDALKALQTLFDYLPERVSNGPKRAPVSRRKGMPVDVQSKACVEFVLEHVVQTVCDLKLALTTNRQDRSLRQLYAPHVVTYDGNQRDRHCGMHDSYSQAVMRFAIEIAMQLPFTNAGMVAATDFLMRNPKKDTPIPEIDFAVAFAKWDELRDKLRSREFDSARLTQLLRREYAAVADEIGEKRDKPTDKTTELFAPRYSEWIDAAGMTELMSLNNVRGSSDKNLIRKKEQWKAEDQVGSGGRRFRFDLNFLDQIGINYPPEWNAEKPVK